MPDLSRSKNPDSFEFMNKSRQMVFDRVKARLETNNEAFDFTINDVTVHWFRKILGSWEVHMTTTLPDSIFYVVRHDENTKTTTFDIYHKFESKTISDQEVY